MLYLLSKKAVKNENTEAKNNFPLTLEAKKTVFYLKKTVFLPLKDGLFRVKGQGEILYAPLFISLKEALRADCSSVRKVFLLAFAVKTN